MSLTKNANKFKLTKTKKTKYIVTSIDLSGFIERQEEIKKKTTVSKKETLTLLSLNFNLKLKFLCFNINKDIVPRIKHTPKAILL